MIARAEITGLIVHARLCRCTGGFFIVDWMQLAGTHKPDVAGSSPVAATNQRTWQHERK